MKSHKKTKSHKKKSYDLKGVAKKVYDLLLINPTTKFLNKKLNKDKRYVDKYISILIEKGYIKRIDQGLFKVIKKSHKTIEVLTPSHKHFRLHNLEIRINIPLNTHKIIHNLVIKNSQYYNYRSWGHVGHYFDLDVTGGITKNNLFLFYPKDWFITGKTQGELCNKLYDVVEQTLRKWESKFKVRLFKDGRVNFDIRNIHIAYVDGDVVDEFKKREVNKLVIRDHEDGKARFLVDMSLGFPEFELVHSKKAISDTDEVKYWGGTLADGSYRSVMEDIKDNVLLPSKIAKSVLDLHKAVLDTQKQLSELAQAQLNTNDQIQSFVELMKPKTINTKELINERADYIR